MTRRRIVTMASDLEMSGHGVTLVQPMVQRITPVLRYQSATILDVAWVTGGGLAR